MLERPDVKNVWKTFVYHPFVMAMGDGTLPMESFKQYLIQDYLYLVRVLRSPTEILGCSLSILGSLRQS